jgi:hypothetical protein
MSKQHRGRFKLSHGFKTGDIVNANIPNGKYAGRYQGLRCAVRSKPTFTLYPKNKGKHFDAHCKYLTTVDKADGFAFSFAAFLLESTWKLSVQVCSVRNLWILTLPITE